MNQHPIKEGDATSLADGKVPFGAVRKVSLDGRDELLGYVENASEFAVPTSAVESVHSGKVIFKGDQLADDMRDAIRHVAATALHFPCLQHN